jgi:hypothetical protein
VIAYQCKLISDSLSVIAYQCKLISDSLHLDPFLFKRLNVYVGNHEWFTIRARA